MNSTKVKFIEVTDEFMNEADVGVEMDLAVFVFFTAYHNMVYRKGISYKFGTKPIEYHVLKGSSVVCFPFKVFSMFFWGKVSNLLFEVGVSESEIEGGEEDWIGFSLKGNLFLS